MWEEQLRYFFIWLSRKYLLPDFSLLYVRRINKHASQRIRKGIQWSDKKMNITAWFKWRVQTCFLQKLARFCQDHNSSSKFRDDRANKIGYGVRKNICVKQGEH